MGCHPASSESIRELRELRDRAADRGDECLSALLAGIDLFVALGRELEVLDALRGMAQDVRHAAEHTPTAEDLRRLYDMDDSGSGGGES